MSEKQSPAASFASSGNGGTPQSRNSPISRLVVTKQPPTHVYPNEWFEVQFDIEMAKGKGSLDSAEFVATLHHQKSRRQVDDDVSFSVMPPAPVRFSSKDTSPKRKRTLRCRISPNDVRRDKASAFFVQLTLRESSGSTIEIMPATTNQVNVVNYKINISVSDEWNPVWYKDEGGRDKCMTIEAMILNREGTLCIGDEVPLQMTLYYDHAEQPVKVGRQNIFRVIGPLINKTDKRSGKVTLRFRIDDVSKNHQGQDFRVEVAPDSKAKGFQDVAPGFSPAVSIRSKRNKRQRLGSTSRAEQSRYPASPSIRSQQISGGMRDELGTVASFRGADMPQLREAIKGVMQWTEEVVNGLYPLQWQLIGYAQNPDGSPDYSRPYHSMSNPNECISRVLSMYSEVTREHLRLLVNSIEGSESSLQGSLVALPRTAPRMPDETMMGGPGMMPFPLDPRFGPPGMPMHASMASRGPFIPSVPSMSMTPDVFRDKGDSGYPLQAAAHGLQSPLQPQNPLASPAGNFLPGGMMRMTDMEGMSMSAHAASMPQGSRGETRGEIPVQSIRFDDDTRESEVAYVLAKQFKATRTGERLGFPAYSESKEILGFYRESSMKVGVGQFIPISQHQEEFGPMEMMQATQILNEAMETKRDSVYALKDWGSIANLIDHALVYDWSKDIGGASASGDSGD